ncbi:MAG: dTMP kinase [Planctomycetes bacterium]|nr:dTMP kinase [Planctomycetota bacterium]
MKRERAYAIRGQGWPRPPSGARPREERLRRDERDGAAETGCRRRRPFKLKPRGRFIVLDGPDGAGKTTQVALLAASLRRAGLRVVRAKDPGATPAGRAIRRILLHGRDGSIAPDTELFLYLAARAELSARVIAPALARGDWVVCDRYSPSTVAYQGAAAGRNPAAVERLCRAAEGGVRPDLVVILDLPVEAGLRRMRRRLDRMERKGAAFLRAVRRSFLAQARRNRWPVVRADGTPKEVGQRVRTAVRGRLDR